MTKETKNTVSAETIVENLKEFAEALHDAGKKQCYTIFLSYLKHNIIQCVHISKSLNSAQKLKILSFKVIKMKFEFSLPRNTKLKSLNMVINSNDRQHQTDKAKVTKRIRAFAYWHTSMNKDKGRAAFSPSNPCEVTVTIYSPTKSKLDSPNLYPTVKAIIDGMTDAGIWTDDNNRVIKKLSFVGLSEEKGHYRLEFDIEEVE